MKVIFAGTPEFSVVPLKLILRAGHKVQAVFTQPDRPAGRGRKLTQSAVKVFAEEAELKVLQPDNLKSAEIQKTINNFNADVMVVVAYGVILPQKVLDMPKYGCLNIHASLLPRWRGAAPIQRAIAAQDKTSGISIMQMDAGLDTGDVVHTVETKISKDDTSSTLHDRLSVLGAEAICQVLDNIDNLNPEPQDSSKATYAHKIKKSEAVIDWSESAPTILAKIKAFNPWPVTQTKLDDKVYRIWDAQLINKTTTDTPGTICDVTKDGIDIATGTGLIRVKKLQLPGKKAMAVIDFLNSKPSINIGQKFI